MDKKMVVTFPGNKKVDASFKGFTINTDQPIHQAGDGSAPAPFDLFLTSIGTCAGLYLLSFCQNRGISTDDLSLTLETEFDQMKRKITKVIIEAHLPSSFPEKYKNAVVKSMNGCAVKKYIESPFVFETIATIKS